MSKTDNVKTIRALKAQVKTLKSLGENSLAAKVEKRIEKLEKESQPVEITMAFEDGRVEFRCPDPGYVRRRAFAYAVKAAGDNTHSFDKETKAWSFKNTPEIIENVKQAIGDFFPRAQVKGSDGESLGVLPESTYVKAS